VRKEEMVLDTIKALTECNQIDIGWVQHPTIKNITIYVTMQLPEVPTPGPSASIGVEGEGSDSGTLEVKVKNETKKSIVVDVYEAVACAERCFETVRGCEARLHTPLYIVSLIAKRRVASEWRRV
jgi:hypothetical protein